MGDPESVARSICLKLLESKARSRQELADALDERGVPDESARIVLDRFTEVGLIDDEDLAQNLVSARHRERGLAARALSLELGRRGIDRELAGRAVAAIDRDAEYERASQLVRAKLRSLAGVSVDTRTRRLVSLLARKGYDSALAYDVVRIECRLVDVALGDSLD
jgi:regulatory protein